MAPRSVATVLRSEAARRPGQPVLRYEGRETTWGELAARSCQVAQALTAEGVGVQDRVAFLDKNGPAYLEWFFGGAMINAINVAVNWRLSPQEMVAVLNDAEATVLVVGAEFADHVAQFEAELTTVKKVVVIGAEVAGFEEFYAWAGRHQAIDPMTAAAADDIAMLVYTSGTSGTPKGVMLTHRNLEAFMAAAVGLDLSTDSVVMVTLPLFHVGGSMWALLGMWHGATLVIHRDVDPAAILDSIESDRITHTMLVPVILFFMLLTPGVHERDYSSLELLAYGTSPIDEDLLRQCLSTFRCRMAQVYGLTEVTAAVVVLRPEDHDDGDHPERLRAAGRPWDGVELRIVDEHGSDVPAGTVGEVLFRTAQTMLGYWRKPVETAETLDDEGWLHTGDAAYVDDEGYVYLVDRIKDMIVSGGENVYPSEVENVLLGHPDVAQVAVVGVPSQRWGESPLAVVVVEVGASPSADELIQHCKERIASYKCPAAVDFVADLPRTMTGKVLRRALRERYWTGFDRRVN